MLACALGGVMSGVIGKVSARHAAEDLRDFLDLLDHEVEPGLAVHVICDNLSAHKAPVVHEWLAAHPRFAHLLVVDQPSGRGAAPGGRAGIRGSAES
ncbi:hypothetical protein BV882_37380 [Streptomyces sp. 46]|nr:hypothetical protein BV882_37380 [Streptomyces sp. 46]